MEVIHHHRLKYIHLEERKLTIELNNMKTIYDLGQSNFTGVVEAMLEYSELERAWEGGRAGLQCSYCLEKLYHGKGSERMEFKKGFEFEESFYFIFRVCVHGCVLFFISYSNFQCSVFSLTHISIHKNC